jgi:hypothetical protein
MFPNRETISKIKRPRILARAARAGAQLYERDRDLKQILPGLIGRRAPTEIVNRLSEAEAACEAARRGRSATYSIDRHVQLLTALVAELAGLNRSAAG